VALAYLGMAARTNVYIDGFNLYYGALRDTAFKWLDVKKLSLTLLPGIRLNRIRYFTARVKQSPHDLNAPLRQDIYLRALRTIPKLSIHEGRFVRWGVLMPQYPLAYPKGVVERPQCVQVQKTEEKGSDVNLATYLLIDCFADDFDEAAVISNDADLALPIERVVRDSKKPITVINPHSSNKISGNLIRVASFHKRTINRSVLAACQFPPILQDSHGTFSKPASW